MYNQNRTFDIANFINILDRKTNHISSHILNGRDWNTISKKTLPCKYQTNMSVLQGIVLSAQTKLDYARQRLSIPLTATQDLVWDHCQQIDHTISIAHLSLRIALLGIHMQHQYLRMYYIQLAVSTDKKDDC